MSFKDYSNIKKNLENRIFCIGFNKTATTSLYSFFYNNGIPSKHNTTWNATKK